eukprot:10881185-Karenia_brevis.AAC.1
MSLQRRLPTLQDIKDKVEEFYRGGLQSQSLEQHVLQCFEGASRVFTKDLLEAVHCRRDFQEWYAAAAREKLLDAVPAADDDQAENENLLQDGLLMRGTS